MKDKVKNTMNVVKDVVVAEFFREVRRELRREIRRGIKSVRARLVKKAEDKKHEDFKSSIGDDTP